MSYELPKCRITVLKRGLEKEIAKEFMNEEDYRELKACDLFQTGESFIIDHPFNMPESFPCHGAWSDLREMIISVSAGCSLPWIKEEHTYIAACKDTFKPVIFKIEQFIE